MVQRVSDGPGLQLLHFMKCFLLRPGAWAFPQCAEARHTTMLFCQLATVP